MKFKDQLAWMEKTERLNASYDIRIGDEVIDMDRHPGIVVSITPGVDDEEHGTVEVWQSARYEYGANNCEHYPHFGWKRLLRVMKKVSER